MADWVKKVTKTVSEKGGIFMFVRAQFSSQISSLTDFTVTILLTNIFGVFYGNATLFGNISGGVVNCIINYKWTFKAQDSKIKHVAIKYVMVWLVNLFLNREGTVLVTELVTRWLPMESLPEIIANNVFLIPKIIVSLIVGFGWNYNMQRLFVYKNRDFKKYFVKKNTQNDKKEEIIESEKKHTDDI
ncbi:MAG: GtrA family protein [Dysgonomonas sp.]|jgi:putative flippase GtrA|uniref:GtrA family protein n=1 Tax=unclassified Dysgonomonas TaxID=2630389 RepID=UPI0025C5FF77|nr:MULTISPECIES: GtrA family protein [unclassified Dysgonomonas]MDR1716262.1 GtrA family protein [Prevotella sp.]MDR2005154.1 GtrA family protein [Prevotella sp.]HMM04024.1 GtrA family protein [Dysgonomonas sp.]